MPRPAPSSGRGARLHAVRTTPVLLKALLAGALLAGAGVAVAGLAGSGLAGPGVSGAGPAGRSAHEGPRPGPADRSAGSAGGAVDRARPVPGLPDDPQADRTTTDQAAADRAAKDRAAADRAAAVRAMLAERGRAVRERDRAAFLATVSPQRPAFWARQAALFDALADVPLAAWEYVLDPRTERPADPTLDARYGPGWWAPSVVLRYRLAGFDDRPSVQAQALTLVRRSGRWLVASDDDVEAAGRATVRGLWDAGPVVTVRRPEVLVLGHPGDERLLGEVAGAVQAAVPRVTRFWGPAWSQRVVVLVPRRPDELSGLVKGDLSRIAAVATAEPGTTPGSPPVGDRVVINPATFRRLGPLGRRVVLTHEVLHVATRSVTGRAAPAWLVEGLADHVGYLGARVPLGHAAAGLRRSVRAGRVPIALPDDAAFAGSDPDLEQSYEQAWLAVELLVRRYGRPRVLEFYRAVGRARDADGASLAFPTVLGTTREAFTRAWRADLVARLG